MPRPQTKADLIAAASEGYEKLRQMIEGMSDAELSAEFDFSADDKKKEAHWRRDRNLRDVLVHLSEWHRLLIDFITTNKGGERKPFLPEGYTWRTYGDMNIMFWKKHQDTTLPEAKKMLAFSHSEVMRLMEEYTNEELFSKGVFPWTGGTTLGSYFVSSTSSHYEWAMKKLKAHKKIVYRKKG